MIYADLIAHIARHAHNISHQLDQVDAQATADDVDHWGELTADEQQAVRNKVEDVMRGGNMTLAELWEDQADQLREKGFTRGFTHEPERLTSHLVRPFTELPVADKQRFAVFAAVVRSLFHN